MYCVEVVRVLMIDSECRINCAMSPLSVAGSPMEPLFGLSTERSTVFLVVVIFCFFFIGSLSSFVVKRTRHAPQSKSDSASRYVPSLVSLRDGFWAALAVLFEGDLEFEFAKAESSGFVVEVFR